MSPTGTGTSQLPFDYGHEPSHLEDDFIEGDGNRLALAHIRAFPNWPGPLTLVEGPAKSGKSHLARIWAGRAARTRCCSSPWRGRAAASSGAPRRASPR